MTEEEVAEGVWCIDCEHFEVNDVTGYDWCPACGCHGSKHKMARVMTRG